MMEREDLKENVEHGTVSFPLANYEWNRDKKFIVKLHWHNETEIIFFQKGSFAVNVNMKEYKITEPCFLFVNAGEIHSIVGEEGCRESALVFDLKMLSFEYFDAIQYKIIRPLLEGKIQFSQFIFEDDEIWQEVKRLYKNIIDQSKMQELAAYMKMKANLYELTALLYENKRFLNAENMEESDSYKIENVKKVLAYIHNNYNQKIILNDMAELIGMNSQYFCRYFKKLIGKTPMEYINEVRIEKAAAYLINSDYKIIEIAVICGYDNIGYFIKRFKKEKCISPSEYRKKNKKSK